MTIRTDDFEQQLISLLPRLRVQALALTRNASAAADLVQDAVTNALAARGSFAPGTNFPAWMHRILRNRFISDVRKRRPSADLDDVPEGALAVPAAHEDSFTLKELHVLLGRLPPVQRETLFMVVLQGMSYEQVAETMGCAVGTAKSRVFRARQQLQVWLLGGTSGGAAGDPSYMDQIEADAMPIRSAPAAAGAARPAAPGPRRAAPNPRPSAPYRMAGGTSR